MKTCYTAFWDVVGIVLLGSIFGLALACNAQESRKQPIIIMFTQEGCGPCHRALATIKHEQDAGNLNGIRIAVWDIREKAASAARLKITATPTFLVGFDSIQLRTNSVYDAMSKAKELRNDQ